MRRATPLQPASIVLPQPPTEHVRSEPVDATRKHVDRRALAEHRIIVNLAGREAERLWGRKTPLHVSAYDYEWAEQIAANLPMDPQQVKGFLAWLQARTAEMVLGWHSAIAAVAEELVVRKTLSTVELRRIIRGAPPVPFV
jgi:hypothetical protein